jgi:hypothetical protein
MARHKRESVVRERSKGRVAELLEQATTDEYFELLASAGVGITGLYAVANGTEALEWHADPEVEARILRRIDLRSRLGLPARACIHVDVEPEATDCRCLHETLDQAADATTRASVMRVASRTHAKLWKWLADRPPPRPQPVSRPAPPPPAPRPIPKPGRATQTNTKPARIVRRRRRWYDPPGDSGRHSETSS